MDSNLSGAEAAKELLVGTLIIGHFPFLICHFALSVRQGPARTCMNDTTIPTKDCPSTK